MKKVFFLVVLALGLAIIAHHAKADTIISDVNGVYQFDGNSIDDGDGHNGTDTAVSYVSGLFSQAASFTGNASYVNIGNYYDVSSSTQLSLSFWFRGTSTADQYMFQKVQPSEPYQGYFCFKAAAGERRIVCRLQRNGSGIFEVDSNATYSTLEDGNWHMLVWNIEVGAGSATSVLWVDNSSSSNSGSWDIAVDNPDDLHIGCYSTCNAPYGWNGEEDNFVFLKGRNFTQAEINSAWAGGAGSRIIKADNGIPTLASTTQLKSDAATPIDHGGTTDEDTVVFKAQLNSNGTSTLQLQVEMEPAGASFTGTANVTSGYVSPTTNAAATAMNIPPGSYHWRARVLESGTNNSLTWQMFGTSSSSVDFIVDLARSAYFDGNSAWKWPATNLGFNSTQPFTIEFWYRTSSTATMQLLDTRSDASSNGFAVWKDQSGINFSMNCDGGTSSTIHLAGAARGVNRIDPNTGHVYDYWHHVAITKANAASSTYQYKLYFDTAQQAGEKCYASTSTDSIWIPGNPSSSYNLFSGNIDEVRIWKTERSALDIVNYYDQEVTSTDSNLLGYWRFNGTSTDIKWNNATSGQSGSPTFVTSTPFGHFLLLPGASAVNTSTYSIHWASSTQYSQEWNDGLAAWALGQISVTSTASTSAAELIVDDVSTSTEIEGEYCDKSGIYWCDWDDTNNSIYLNSYWLSQSPYATSGIQDTVMHEFGHALGLDHSWYGNVMNYYQTPRTTLGSQDEKDYHFLWDH